MPLVGQRPERRSKRRFVIEREMRFRVLEDSRIVESGVGTTRNISSAGVAFEADRELTPGAFIELSISWPALLDNACRMRLVAYGRILRSVNRVTVASIEKYEFRTQGSTTVQGPALARGVAVLRRWAEGTRKDDNPSPRFSSAGPI